MSLWQNDLHTNQNIAAKETYLADMLYSKQIIWKTFRIRTNFVPIV